jgi:ATP-dependent DNA helicase PIF1
MDLPLYITMSRSPLFDLGSAAYQLFDRAIVLKQVMRQSGQDLDQVLFRDILLRLRDAKLTISDWEQLMKQTPSEISDLAPFTNALFLPPTVEAVVEHVTRLHANGHPVATIKAVHSGANASKASSEDAGGLEPIICLARNARVMLTSNLWVDMGLVNGAMGTIVVICYRNGESPPNLPIAVTIRFDSYRGPTLSGGMFLIQKWFHPKVDDYFTIYKIIRFGMIYIDPNDCNPLMDVSCHQFLDEIYIIQITSFIGCFLSSVSG